MTIRAIDTTLRHVILDIASTTPCVEGSFISRLPRLLALGRTFGFMLLSSGLRALVSAMAIIKAYAALMGFLGVPRAAAPLHIAAAAVVEPRAQLSAFAVRTLPLFTTILAARADRWW